MAIREVAPVWRLWWEGMCVAQIEEAQLEGMAVREGCLGICLWSENQIVRLTRAVVRTQAVTSFLEQPDKKF